MDACSVLYCRACRNPLTLAARPPTRILPLPSPYWQEIGDLWYCHNAEVAVIKTDLALVPGPGKVTAHLCVCCTQTHNTPSLMLRLICLWNYVYIPPYSYASSQASG